MNTPFKEQNLEPVRTSGKNWSHIAILAGFALMLCKYLIFAYSPIEAEMKLTQKIFYVHLPLAWWGLTSFFVVFAASILYLRSRNMRWDILALAAAEIGVLFIGLALANGAIWAKKSWNSWWIWDPRLSTTLVMWFVYMGYLALCGLDATREKQAAIRAVVGIIAFLDVPLVFFAARLWQSNHPAGVMILRDGLEPEMRLTILACLVAFGLFWCALLMLRCRLASLEQELDILIRRLEEH